MWTKEVESTWIQWTLAIFGSFLVGLSGLVPLIILPNQHSSNVTPVKKLNAERSLNRQLSFAVGGLIGDVFLHLVPEAYEANPRGSGIWVIIGLLSFLLLEKIMDQTSNSSKKKKITGYLNLLANCIDNFIHGLAVASSFLTSFKLGLTTVFAILVHEIPHEIGDFAILLNSGFSR